jgi:hypothetical protein
VEDPSVFFFWLDTWVLALILVLLMFGATAAGLLAGRLMREHSDVLREPSGVLQGAVVGFMGLVLAFGLSLAVGRYENRRADVVEEANGLGTTYLRAQTLAEPVRTESLDLLRRYTDTSIVIARTVPGSDEEERAITRSARQQDELWALAGRALAGAPEANAPRLYVETLNDTFDAQTTRVYGLTNRVPSAVLVLEIVLATIALAVLALHLATMGRGVLAVLIAAALVALLLQVTFDLDRPTRGLITVPATPLVDVRASMSAPVADAPTGP